MMSHPLNRNKIYLAVFIILAVIMFAGVYAYASSDDSELDLWVTDANGMEYHSFTDQNGSCYLYLPNTFADETVTVHSSMHLYDSGSGKALGRKLSQMSVYAADPECSPVSLECADGTVFDLYIQASQIADCSISLYKTDQDQLDGAEHDTTYERNTTYIFSPDGTEYVNYRTEIRGRGNYSWYLDKKGYQLKFSDEASVLGMKASDTWILLANAGDASLVRNKFAFSLAEKMNEADGAEYIYDPEAEYVDLWIDGCYRGNYIICSKPQIGTNRVELTDPDGILVEMDNNYCYKEPVYYTSKVSDSNFVPKDTVADDTRCSEVFGKFMEYVGDFEEQLYSEDPDWDTVSGYIDTESFIRYYFIQEFCENPDGYRSSMYIWRDGEGDVLHMGPVWDMDLSLGSCCTYEDGGDPDADFTKYLTEDGDASNTWFSRLCRIPEFRSALEEYYEDTFSAILAGADEMIDSETEGLEGSAHMNFHRWEILGKDNLFGDYRAYDYLETWEDEVDRMKDFVDARIVHMEKAY